MKFWKDVEVLYVNLEQILKLLLRLGPSRKCRSFWKRKELQRKAQKNLPIEIRDFAHHR